MNDFKKMGGIAALIMAATFVVGIGLAATSLASYAGGDLDPVQKVALLADNQATIYIWNQIIYVVFGIFLVVLALALYERLKAGSPAMMQTATVFGLIWAGLLIGSGMVANIGMETVVDLYGQDPAQAATVWLAIESVVNGIGGEFEILGSLWILLISWAALRAGGLSRALNYFGLVVSAAGLLTVVPALAELGLGYVFGLGSIVWFVWLGIVMLRSSPSSAAA